MSCEHAWEEVRRESITKEVYGIFAPGQAPVNREIVVGVLIELKCKGCGDIKFAKGHIDQ